MKYLRAQLMVLAALFATGTLVQAQEKQPGLEGVKVQRNIEYVPNGHERQKLDLYLPEKADGPLPVIVWIHGGGWRMGSKDTCPAQRFVPKGYAVVSINYRFSNHEVYPAQIEDCKTAIRWIRTNAKKYNFDPDHIGVWGASAGGHLVALLGTTEGVKELEGASLGNSNQSSKVQCVVDWFGPTDFMQMTGPAIDKPDSLVSLLLGGPVKEKPEKAAQASPITFVNKNAAPFLIMHGDKDKLVPLSQSEKMAEALKKAGVEVTLKTYQGSDHGGAAFVSDDSMKMIGDFFDKHLKKAK